MSSPDFLDLITNVKALDESRLAKGESIKKLRESIRPQIELLRAENDDITAERNVQVADFLEKGGLKLLADAEIAKFIYDSSWDNARGSLKLMQAFRNILKDFKYLNASTHYGNDSIMLDSFDVAIPFGAEDANLKETAEALEPILKVQKELLEGTDSEARVEIMGGYLDAYTTYYIFEDDGKYFISDKATNSSLLGEPTTLLEVLKKISKVFPYGSTAECEDEYREMYENRD